MKRVIFVQAIHVFENFKEKVFEIWKTGIMQMTKDECCENQPEYKLDNTCRKQNKRRNTILKKVQYTLEIV